ncbi:hypothetical protein EYC98_19410 [Halieaceae bacterium IMCC14734]|uniref:Uncharacterized protein n=1 Tax=Candidatus Litorirhabdus singularis TaxID=2518993 RepID=A0ABT3TL30_9GAMM|nr:hypothetical protein [Candidatus Litorirhabdus singularis]MCX2983037.1 hypothetical protein [Candidatus Litorirhabdus singularis]
MAKILDFPSTRIQGLTFLQDQIRDLLEQNGADADLQEFAAATVMEIYQRVVSAENYNFALNLPESVSESDAEDLHVQIDNNLAVIQEANHAIIVRLIAELTLAEVKLFQLQNA